MAAPAAGSGDTVLALDGVSKLFGAVAAVDRTSLDVGKPIEQRPQCFAGKISMNERRTQ